MSEVATKKKRKYIDCGGGKKNKRKWWAANSRPKRGSPGVLLTCETGRERKCQREGLQKIAWGGMLWISMQRTVLPFHGRVFRAIGGGLGLEGWEDAGCHHT